MKLPICYYGHENLRKKAKPIKEITKYIEDLVSNMIETMGEDVGIAANQIGVALRLLVIAPIIKNNKSEYIIGSAEVYINPKLSEPSAETEIMSEGCLSFPSLHLDIERPKEITIEALNLKGQVIKEVVKGFKARQIMHENDHLNGVLFIDRFKDEKKKFYLERILKKMKKKYNK
jgi:peptide deformylase